jgi:acyl-CoA reductase-like NAD-dependent aldehyde dehydrogenase
MMTTDVASMADRFPEFDPSTSYQLLIGGAWTDGQSRQTFRCHDPYSDEPWGHVVEATAGDVDAAVTSAAKAFPRWRDTPLPARLRIMERWAALAEQHTEHLTRLQVHENGKTFNEMSRVVQAIPSQIRYFAHLAESLHGHTIDPFVPQHQAWTIRQPLGVVAAIAPWNNPLGLLGWKILPALAVGNTVVVKPSEVTPVSTLELLRLAQEAGMPDGVVNVVTGGADVGRALVDHHAIAKVAFTGSTGAGRAIASSLAPRFIPSVLELGGKGPNIVFGDADLTAAVDGVVVGLTAGNGQACNAGSRVLIHRSVADEVIERVSTALGELRLGDPLDPSVDIGPMASPAHFARVQSYLDLASEEGLPLLHGGRVAAEAPGVTGNLAIEPTVFEAADQRSRLVQEEIFGPVGALTTFESEDEALKLANGVPFGLVAGVWTQDIDRAHRMSRSIESGVVWINTWRMFSGNVPFGGTKLSGWGRETGIEAARAFTEEKSVWLRTRPAPDTSAGQ